MIYRPWHQSSCSIGESSSLICRINKAFFTTFIAYFKTSLWVSLIHIVFHQCLLVKYETGRANLLIKPLFGIFLSHQAYAYVFYWISNVLLDRNLQTKGKASSEGFTNPLTPKSDRNLISLNSISPESNINVMRMKGMITNPRSS